jgi:hypothetical protein
MNNGTVMLIMIIMIMIKTTIMITTAAYMLTTQSKISDGGHFGHSRHLQKDTNVGPNLILNSFATRLLRDA